MSYFPHAFQKMFIASTFSTKTGQSTVNLVGGELAVVNAKTNAILQLAGTGDYLTTPQVYIAQGSFHANDKIGPFHGGYKESIKSKGINPRYISEFYVTEPAAATQQIVAVGCGNGTTDFLCGKTYYLRVDVKGSPALRYMTRNLYKTFDAFTGCCDDPETPVAVDPLLVYGAWADQINGDAHFKNFVAASLEYFIKDGSTWYSAGTVKPTGSTISYAKIAVAGTTYTNGTHALTFTGGGGTGAAGTVTVAGGIATSVTITNHGSGYTSTPTISAPGAGSGSGTLSIIAYRSVWDSVIASDKDVKLKLAAAYASTTFGDSSFDPTDHVEYEPLQIYASLVDDTGEPCNTLAICVAEQQAAYQGKGYGETLIREYILSQSYSQEYFNTDPRMREVQQISTLTDLNRANSYYVYYILHSVPRKANPSSTMDADQYLLKIVTSARSTDFENYINELLSSSGNAVQLSVKL